MRQQTAAAYAAPQLQKDRHVQVTGHSTSQRPGGESSCALKTSAVVPCVSLVPVENPRTKLVATKLPPMPKGTKGEKRCKKARSSHIFKVHSCTENPNDRHSNVSVLHAQSNVNHGLASVAGFLARALEFDPDH